MEEAKTKENRDLPDSTRTAFVVVVALVLGVLGISLQIFSAVATDVDNWMPNLPLTNAIIAFVVSLLALILCAKPDLFTKDPLTGNQIAVGLGIYALAQASGGIAAILASNTIS